MDWVTQNHWHIASTSGILAYRLKALVSVQEHMQERHGEALAAIDADEFHGALETRTGTHFARKVMEVADHIFYLAMDVCRECSTSSIAATVLRRRLWLHAMGITDRSLQSTWLNHPTRPTELGLFDVMPERLDTFKKQQDNQSALAKELKVAKTR